MPPGWIFVVLPDFPCLVAIQEHENYALLAANTPTTNCPFSFSFNEKRYQDNQRRTVNVPELKNVFKSIRKYKKVS